MIIQFRRKLIIHDLPKVRLQGSASYKAAVDVGLSEQLRRVARVYGPAVLDAHRCSGRVVVLFRDAVPDDLADLLGLFCGGGLAGADCPDGLVGNYHPLHLLRGHVCQIGFNLQANPVHRDAHLSLFQGLPTA